MASPNTDIGQLLSHTLNAYKTKLTDQIMVGTRTLKVLSMKEGFKQKEQGGATIRVPIQYAESKNVKWMGEYDNYLTNPQQVFDAAEFPWASIAGTAVVTHAERVKNSGKHAVIKLVKSKMDNLVESLQQDMNRVIFSDGTVANEPAGLRAIVSTTGTYGGISHSANTWWAGQVDSTAEALSVADMRSSFNLCSANVTAPNVIVTTRTLYEKYEGLAQSFQQITESKKGDLGFEHLQFKGVPLFWDDDCPTESMYFLNTRYLWLFCHPEWEWEVLDPIKRDQALEIHAIEWWGNFVCSGPRYQGVLRNKT